MSAEIMRHEDMPLGELARAAAASRFFQVDPAQAIVKVLMGRELGVPPIASLTDIHVIKGKPVIGAGMIASRIKASAKYNYKCRQATAERCDLEFFEEGESVGVHSYTMEMAHRAGNASKDNYRKYTEDMLFARAISTGYKRYCPDVFSSKVFVPGELDDSTESAPLAARPTTTVTVSTAAPLQIEQAPAPLQAQLDVTEDRDPEPDPAPDVEIDTPAPRRRRRRAAV
mgnify:CR=1 FL=1